VIEYGIIFWGKSTNVCHVCTLQQRIIRIMSGVRDENSCRNVFKELGILHVQDQYILSLMFVMDNQKNFQTKLSVYRLDTRNKNHLYLLIANLLCFQRGVSYPAMNMFNSPPHNIKNHWNDVVQFKFVLRECLIFHSFYSLTEFVERLRNTI
jgi:hypothetical protein